jgi:hypothetical protein
MGFSMKTIDVKYVDTNKYVVKLHHDDFEDSPTEWGMYSIVQFRDNDWTTYESLEDSEYVTETMKLTPATQAKLRSGKMFIFDYYRYSSTDGGFYRFSGGVPVGEVDSQEVNGFISFSDEAVKGMSYEDRKQMAKDCLREYTSWANGEVYYVEIERDTGLPVDSCGGFIGSEAVDAYVKEIIGEAEYEEKYVG